MTARLLPDLPDGVYRSLDDGYVFEVAGGVAIAAVTGAHAFTPKMDPKSVIKLTECQRQGGMGGLQTCRDLDKTSTFEVALALEFGDDLRADATLCREMFAALGNVIWMHERGDTYACTMRAAGDLVAAIRRKGCYMDWYPGGCGHVNPRIAERMKPYGWSWRRYD